LSPLLHVETAHRAPVTQHEQLTDRAVDRRVQERFHDHEG